MEKWHDYFVIFKEIKIYIRWICSFKEIVIEKTLALLFFKLNLEHFNAVVAWKMSLDTVYKLLFPSHTFSWE